MSDAIQGTPVKAKRAYNRKPLVQVPQQPIAPSPQIAVLESGIAPLVNQRLEANQKVRIAAAQANQANANLQAAQGELAEVEQEINYRMNLIGQLRNGGMPVPQQPYIAQNLQYTPPGYINMPPSAPYTPVAAFPTMPPFSSDGVSSFPAPNRGLYPDATDRLESAEDVRQLEQRQRGL